MADFAALALKLISKHGRRVVLRRDVGTAAAEVGKPWRGTTRVEAATSTVAFFMDSQSADLLARVTAVSRLVLSPVEVNTTVAFVPGTIAVAPTIAMHLDDNGRRWAIKEVGKIEQGTKTAVYVLELAN